jgi:chorismate dehydratase
MKTIKLGAVDYLNARPLVYGLELKHTLFSLRFDTPSKCAALLHEGSIDVGMIPSIEYLRGPSYRIVPSVGIISDGAVASVALFSSKPLDRVASIAADTSSRTSTALAQVLCSEVFGIDPEFIPMPPDIGTMLGKCDAALLIGDPALFLDHVAAGLLKTDLGTEWTKLTGLPFVWAFWAGRPHALTQQAVETLESARDGGVEVADELADAYCGGGRAALGRRYFRENMRYILGEREADGLKRYYELAEEHELVPRVRRLEFY